MRLTSTILYCSFFILHFPLPVLSDDIPAEPAKVELLSELSGVVPGKPVTLGLKFKMEKGWHIYWRNSGDSGLPPRVTWDLPKGFKTGEILWPAPERLEGSAGTDYGYNDEVLLMVPVEVPTGLEEGSKVKFAAKVKWLVCHDVCLPGEKDVALTLRVKEGRYTTAVKVREVFEGAKAALPQEPPKDWRFTATLDRKGFQLLTENGPLPEKALFFPLHPEQVENAAPQDFRPLEKGFQLGLKRSEYLSKDVETLEGVLVVWEKDGKARKAYRIGTKVHPK